MLASLGSAKFAMHKSGRVAAFPGWDNPLVAVPPLRYNGSQEGAACLFNATLDYVAAAFWRHFPQRLKKKDYS